VVTQVIFHEGGDEVVAVVVALLHAQLERLIGARLAQQLRAELAFEELIPGALIDQQRARKAPRAQQLDRVVLRPGGAIFAEVA
jgi:hypothetical protein